MRWTGIVLTLVLVSGSQINAQALVNPASSGQNQARPPADQLLEELTKEIRLLRLSLEQWHLEDGQRTVVIELYRVQRDLVVSVSERLGSVRSELADVRTEAAKTQEDLRAAQDRSRSNSDRERQQVFDDVVGDIKEGLADVNQREARLNDEERRLLADSDDQNRKLQSLEQQLNSFVTLPPQR